MIYIFTFILALCSIVYELLLGQSLSAFLGNTVLRYSVTIGLYMFSMGIGALMAEGKFVKNAVTNLLKVEILLTVLGGFSVIFLLVLDSVGMPPLLFSFFAHALIMIIGILTGFEIPLLMHMKNLEKIQSESLVLGVSYLGAFLGTVLFAFVFYPLMGLIPTAFLVAAMNAAVGLALLTQASKVQPEENRPYRVLITVQSILLIVLLPCLFFASTINELFLTYYLES
jgi:spermidine synthase